MARSKIILITFLILAIGSLSFYFLKERQRPTPELEIVEPIPTETVTIEPTPTPNSTPSPKITQIIITPTTTQTPAITDTPTISDAKSPKDLMPDKPIIESFCDNKGNCVHSQFADINSNSISNKSTVYVGESLSFTINISGSESNGALGFILEGGYSGPKKPWSKDLTFVKRFSEQDITTSDYPIYAYIKSQNDNYHRRSNGCNWIDYACDDNATLYYNVLP